ncbi:synaptobrevin [Pseudovirgaria hyperparasitica]|uniref:Synaptobrevin n=1 Tax=Pseudovirgaria hyperparasitica TaxID=470096 RepID=A0A6A6WEP9_9PEZI|nr:synaptobrevin [Pseudovirgaria hyperparasitica]KAF2761193.1 synaptobrevin [Pseudovirgaria hyperparasitica]
MKIYYMGILKNDAKPIVELCAVKDLSSYGFLQKNAVGEFMTVFSKGVAEGIKPGQRHDAEQEQYVFHAYGRSEGIAGIIISDSQYPSLVAHQLLSKITDEFLTKHPRATFATLTQDSVPVGTYRFPELDEYIRKYQDPEQADNIMKIQRELDETKIVLHKTIESVLQRGQNLDKLVDQSNDLSYSSRQFYKGAKKQNSCCVVM